VNMVDIAEDEAEGPLSLAKKLWRVPRGVMRYISATTR